MLTPASILRAGRVAAALGVAAALTAGCNPKQTATSPTSHRSSGHGAPTGTSAAPAAAGGSCHARPGPLPDASCTPGATNPQVSQANIKDTVCKSGWTATIRPPVSVTNKLKHDGITAYGYTDTNMHDYEEDHLISLELGGAPDDPKNLWPEPGASPNPKDKVENDLNAAVCSGRIQLAAAQHAIATDWTTAERVVGIG